MSVCNVGLSIYVHSAHQTRKFTINRESCVFVQHYSADNAMPIDCVSLLNMPTPYPNVCAFENSKLLLTFIRMGRSIAHCATSKYNLVKLNQKRRRRRTRNILSVEINERRRYIDATVEISFSKELVFRIHLSFSVCLLVGLQSLQRQSDLAHGINLSFFYLASTITVPIKLKNINSGCEPIQSCVCACLCRMHTVNVQRSYRDWASVLLANRT